MKTKNILLVCIVLAFLIGCASHPVKDKIASAANLEKYLMHIKQGNEMVMDKQYKNAIIEFRSALAINPHIVELYNLIGICYVQLKQFNRATDEFLQAIGRNPSFAAAHNNLGTAYYAQSNYPEAAREFKEALRLNPEMASAYHNLANIYIAQNEIELAIEFYKKAFKINPDYLAFSSTFSASVDEFPRGKGEKEYSYACVLASQNKIAKALEYLQKAIDNGFSDWDKIKNEPDFQSLQENTQFKKLIEKKH